MRKALQRLVLTAGLLAGAVVTLADAQAMPAPSLGASAPVATSIEKVWCCRYYRWHRHYWVWHRPYYYGYGWRYRHWGWRW